MPVIVNRPASQSAQSPDATESPKALPLSNLPELSASWFHVYWYPQEFLLYLGNRATVVNPDGQLDLQSRVDALVRLSPTSAKQLTKLLNQLVNQYEAAFGIIPDERLGAAEPVPPADQQ